jgi:hypothetical protein
MFGGERRWRFEQKPTKITKGRLPSLFPSFSSVDLQEFILQKTEDFFRVFRDYIAGAVASPPPLRVGRLGPEIFE